MIIKNRLILLLFLQLLLLSLYPSTQCRSVFWSIRTLACLDGNKVPSWPISEELFKLLHSHIQLQLLSASASASKELCELDWHSHNLIDCRTFLVNVILDVLDVSISEDWKQTKRMCLRFPLLSDSLVTITAAFLNIFFLQIVLTSEKVRSKWLSLSHFPPYFPLFFSNTVTIHIRMFGDLSLHFLRAKACCTEREGFMLTDLSLQTLYFYECTAEFCCRGPLYIQLSFPLLGWRTVSLQPPTSFTLAHDSYYQYNTWCWNWSLLATRWVWRNSQVQYASNYTLK